MNARLVLRLLAALSAALWGLAVATGGGGLIHLLAVLAVLAFLAQTQLRVALTPFEAWVVREAARRAERKR